MVLVFSLQYWENLAKVLLKEKTFYIWSCSMSCPEGSEEHGIMVFSMVMQKSYFSLYNLFYMFQSNQLNIAQDLFLNVPAVSLQWWF